MNAIKEQLQNMLNSALALEHAARIQYLTHAEQAKGQYDEPIIERLKEIASDEKKHEGKFRSLIERYFNETPTMKVTETSSTENTKDTSGVKFDKKTTIDFYKTIYQKIIDNKAELQHEFEAMEHELRHVIIDEEEHLIELFLLFGT